MRYKAWEIDHHRDGDRAWYVWEPKTGRMAWICATWEHPERGTQIVVNAAPCWPRETAKQWIDEGLRTEEGKFVVFAATREEARALIRGLLRVDFPLEARTVFSATTDGVPLDWEPNVLEAGPPAIQLLRRIDCRWRELYEDSEDDAEIDTGEVLDIMNWLQTSIREFMETYHLGNLEEI